MLQQVANFSGMASPRHLHIKRVGGRPPLEVPRSQAAGPPPPGGTPGFGPGRRPRDWARGPEQQWGRSPRGPPPPATPRGGGRPSPEPRTPPALIRGRGRPPGRHAGARVGGASLPKCVYSIAPGDGWTWVQERKRQRSVEQSSGFKFRIKVSNIPGSGGHRLIKTTLVLKLQCRH